MWWSGLVLGFAGSLHCLVMCSPLAVAATAGSASFIRNRITYNLGRILCYGLLGAMVSGAGSMFRLQNVQVIVSVAVGMILIVAGVGGNRWRRIPFITSAVEKFILAIKGLFGRFLRRKTPFSVFMLGVINGLLPCGLTYLALSYCIIETKPATGFIFMISFGAGTLPVMLGLTSGLGALLRRWNFSTARLTTVMMIFLGAFLVTRTLYASPHGTRAQKSETPVSVCQ